MKDNLIININNTDIEYIESNNNNIKIEYKYNKFCILEEYNDDKFIIANTNCRNINKIGKEVLKNINNKKLIPLDIDIEKVTVYTTKANIEKLEKNYKEQYERNIKDNNE